MNVFLDLALLCFVVKYCWLTDPFIANMFGKGLGGYVGEGVAAAACKGGREIL
jgi:hypothetical protein